MARGTYRSKGVHTNRKGGKSPRTAVDRNGQLVAEKKKAARKAKMQAAATAIGDASQGLAEDQARFGAEHDQAAAEGRANMQRQMMGTPGKAQDIIKRRRV